MKNNKKGFTLVELVIVVAVMAVLVAVAIPTVSSIVGTAEEAVAESNAKTIESMIKLEQAEIAGGNATLTAAQIEACLTAAALGIDKGEFTFDQGTGKVTVGEATLKDQFSISFDKDRTVTSGTGANAVTSVKPILVTKLTANVETDDGE